MAPGKTAKCSVCSSDTTTFCTRCAEGLDISGHPTKTYYCSKVCQQQDWKEHRKGQCQHANARKKLFRGAAIIQELFEACWEMRMVVRPDALHHSEDGKLHVRQDLMKSDVTQKVLPMRNFAMQDRARKALLSWSECSASMMWGCGLILELLRGILKSNGVLRDVELVIPDYNERVLVKLHTLDGTIRDVSAMCHEVMLVELIDDHLYVIDLAGAQIGQMQPVVAWDEYGRTQNAKWHQQWNYGARAQYWNKMLNGMSDESHVARLDLLYGQFLLDQLKRWEAANGKTIGSIVMQSAEQFEQDRLEMLKDCSAALTEKCRQLGGYGVELGTGILWKVLD